MLQDNIRSLRKARGLSQEEVAQRLHITRQTLSKWENGLSVPDAQLLLKLAEILEVSVAQLLEGSTETNEEEQDTVAEQLERLNLLLADGKRRRVDHPKRKRAKHVLLAGEWEHPAMEKVRTGLPVRDRELRAALAAFREEMEV